MINKILYLILFSILFSFSPADAQMIGKAKLRWMRDKPVIDSIVINGNIAFSDSEIKDQMYSKKRNFWNWLKKDRRNQLQRETLNRDTLEIKYLYLINGYLNIRVKESFENLPDTSAMIIIDINEGYRFVYGQKNIEGSYKDKFSWPLQKEIAKLKEGKPTNPIQIQQTVFDLKTIFANDGYPYATIDFIIDTSAPPASDITFVINSDSLVYFGDVAIDGIESYPEKVGNRELKIKPGNVYRRKEIIDSQKRLFESGYFTLVQLKQAPNSVDRLHPEFQLNVRERKPYFVQATTGAGQSAFNELQWDFSISTGKRNIFGSRRINFMADYSFSVGEKSRLITHRYRLRYTEPWLFGIRMPLLLTGEYEPHLRFEVQDFRIRSWSISASTIKRIGEEIRLTGGVEYDNVKISDIPIGSDVTLAQLEGISIRRKFFGTFRLDSRDNIFIPRRGALTEISSEYFGGFLGGDNNFYKLQTSWSTYQVVWPGWIGAVRIKLGWSKPFGESNIVPTEELLYLGGANTIRGFTENSLGPQLNDSTAAGANFIFIFNQEFRWKTIQALAAIPGLKKLFKKFPLWQSVFFDMGNGYEKASEMNLDNMAFSYGTGFQLVSPAGPIRIDYARSIRTKRYEVASRWHFTILYAF